MTQPYSIPPLSPQHHEDKIEALRVLATEKEGLEALQNSIDAPFCKAIDLLCTAKGRVVFTGVGKSGHIARKIASTMASTGTPAFFIHPAEASHGDLGMLARGDALVALSNSGETKELSEILAFAKTMHLPLIAITCRPQSTLARLSDVALMLPAVPEACPLRLAPTTSTLMMLALGDALCMALLKRRGFTTQDFGRLHPGGRLGARLTKIEKVMRPYHDLPLVTLGTSMKEALITMTEKSLGCVGVLNLQNSLCGIITDGDLRRHMSSHLLEQNVEDIMTPSPFTLKSSLLIQEAASFLNEKAVTGAFVVNHAEVLVGFIHLHDCLKHGRDAHA